MLISRRDYLALALLWLAPCAAFLGLFAAGKSPFWGDLTYIHHPWRVLSADMLERGVLPLWNPYAYMGMPLAAQLQNGCWYPGAIPFFLFPFAAALAGFHALHYGLLATFTFLLLRRIGCDPTAAWIGAFLFMGNGVLISRLPFLNHLSALSYLPAFVLLAGRSRLLSLSLTLCFFCGYPPFLVGGALCAFVLSWFLAGGGVRGLANSMRRWAKAALMSAGIGACLLLPALRLMRQSHRGLGLGLEETLLFGFSPRDWAQLVSPIVMASGDFSPAILWWKTSYLGLFAWVFVVAALPRLKWKLLVGMCGYIGTVGFLILGASTSVSAWVWGHFPPLRYIRYPGNLSYMLLPALCALAAIGAHRRRLATIGAFLMAAELSLYALSSHPVVRRDYFTNPGTLARGLQKDLGTHRYLLSPLALEWHRGKGEQFTSAALDLKHRFYGLTNLPYRIAAAGNFGEPLVPKACYDFMDFLYRLPGPDAVAPYLAWADIELLMTRERFAVKSLVYVGENLWHLYAAGIPVARAYWLPPDFGATLPESLPEVGSPAPDVRRAVPVTLERLREDHIRVRANTAEGWLYLAEPKAPGWKAWLGGARVDSRPVLGPFQMFHVASGDWDLRLRYDPWLWRIGVLLTVLCLLAAAYWYNRAPFERSGLRPDGADRGT